MLHLHLAEIYSPMRLISRLAFLAAVVAALPAAAFAAPAKPLKVLLITGGCCHDYDLQAKAFKEGAGKLAEIDWTVVNEGGKGTQAEIPLYNNPDWAKPYDVVVHNECFANTTNEAYIRKITTAHKAGKPAVVIHCAMHSYRAATIDDWREFLGVTSRRHTKPFNIPVKIAAPGHSTMKGFKADWVTPIDELYVIEKMWPHTTALATAVSPEDKKEYPLIWASEYGGKTRVFGTTLGHNNETVADPRYLDLVARGLQWSVGRL